jgi:membrane protease subunit HflC
VVKTFGKPRVAVDPDGQERVRIYEPGLHWQWPYPIDTLWRHDSRVHCYELEKGRVEQIQTRDDYQVIVTTYVLWRVGDAGLFLKRVDSTDQAEPLLDNVVRNSRNLILGRHSLSELISTEAGQTSMRDIEEEMLEHLRATAMAEYGIEVVDLGFRHLGFPEAVSLKVFERMRAERARKSERYLAEGAREAQRIRSAADREVSDILARAQAEAKGIRGRGDEEAAMHYAVFRENPELAAFLRKLEALRTTLSNDTTLVLDTQTPPYDLLRPGATELPGADRAPGEQSQQTDAE